MCAAFVLLSAFVLAFAGCNASSERPELEENIAAKSLAATAAFEFHVAKTGSDSNAGTSSSPFLTIQRAATAAQPGDTITVHAGTYREWVDPPRGGSSESARITYRAAPGEAVYLKGSERISTWVASGAVWVATIPSSFFGSFNPYSLTVANAFLSNPGTRHRGQVYLNGVPYTEVSSAGSVGSAGLWASSISGSNTVITAHFGSANPNSALVEINVRRLVFAPTKNFLGYITVNGFHIQQAATNWSTAEGGEEPQEGAIAPNAGFKWRIERNWVSDSRCSCVALGRGGTWGQRGTANADETNSGSHLVRYNTVERCGEAGINGSRGAIFSTIEFNLVQDINVGDVFSSFEGAALKFHTALDMVIRGNVLRRTTNAAVSGIWLDWQSQGSRITGNAIYAIGSNDVIVLEADHGPTLIDNNVLIGGTIKELAESVCVAHNLLKGIGFYVSGDGRTPAYHVPHQYTEAGTASIAPKQNTYYNNVLMGSGSVPNTGAVGNFADYNYGYDSIGLSGAHSKTTTASSGLSTTDNVNGVTVTFTANGGPAALACPVITKAFIGNSTLVGMGLENHDGSAITIDKDAFGNSRGATPTAGPFQSLATGVNSFRFYAGADAPTSVSGNVAPTVAAPATATAVVATTTTLSVTGADDGGASNLNYTWALSAAPSGGSATFSPNGNNAAHDATATFSKAGSYTLQVVIADAQGASVTSSVSVIVSQSYTSIVLTPANASVAPGRTQQFSALAKDQFGFDLTTQPAFTWSLSGGGTLSGTGLFSAGNTAGGPFTITAQSGGKTASAAVTVAAVSVNLALNRPVTASSIEASGTTPSLAVDGDATTRWSSSYSDPQWIAIDLGAVSTIARVKLSWQNSFGKSYEIQVSNDGASWTTIFSTTTNSGGVNDLTGLSGSGRYVRMYGTVRSTQFGYSLWEFEVYGTGTSSNPPVVVASANPSTVTGTSSALSAVATDDSGEANLTYGWAAVSAPSGAVTTFSVNGSHAAQNTLASFSRAGSYALQCTVTDRGGSSAASVVNVTVNQTSTTVSVSPTNVSVAPNRTQLFSALAKDQFSVALTTQPAFTWSVSGGGAVSGAGLFSAGSAAGGPFTVTAQSGVQSGTANVTVSAAASANLALNKPVSASSIEGSGTTTSFAVDGNVTTRWSSSYSDPQWIAVDLGAISTVARVKLNWESAYGKSYLIQVSNDGASWTTLFSTTSNAGGVNDLTGLSGSGRYVRMYGTVRGSQWGYSLWAFEVYGQ